MKCYLIFLFTLCTVYSFAPDQSQLVPAGSNHATLNTNKLADELEKRFKNKCIGFEFVISYKGSYSANRCWGMARQSQDAPARSMTDNEKYNIASTSKPITGAALIKALAANKDLTIDSKIYKLLPSHWIIDPSVRVISFRDLLTHTSGFGSSGIAYADLKDLVKKGINPNDHGKDRYENCNYALMRLLIPALIGSPVIPVPEHASGAILESSENMQAAQFATFYMDYVQKKLFDATGDLPKLQCKPVANNPALCYQFPKTAAHGGDFGDHTLTCGSSGWNMSARQMSIFFRHLHFTDEILSPSLNSVMKKSCYESGTTTKDVDYYEKEGYYPGSENPGELNSVIVGFGNGIIITGIVNSQCPAIEETVRDAFDAWYH